MATYLYTRVSTEKQTTENQEHILLQRFPDGIILNEVASGVKERPVLNSLMGRLLKGDTIAIVSLDRLGRNLIEIITRIDNLYKRGITVISVREGVDYSTPTGRLATHMLVALAEMERNLISERTKEALQARKAQGMKLGRPFKMSAEELPAAFKAAKRMYQEGYTYREMHQKTGLSMGALCRLLKDEPFTGPIARAETVSSSPAEPSPVSESS